MREYLESIWRALGPPPRSLGWWTRYRLRPKPPHWMAGDPLEIVYQHFDRVLQEGRVVWSSLIQANRLLFRPGDQDCPALVLYSPDPAFDETPETLQEVASRIFELKGSTPEDPALAQAAQLVTDEMDRSMGWQVPPVITNGKMVRAATLMVFRKHLPGGRIQSGWFPLLIHPTIPVVLIVPAQYWPDSLVKLWEDA